MRSAMIGSRYPRAYKASVPPSSSKGAIGDLYLTCPPNLTGVGGFDCFYRLLFVSTEYYRLLLTTHNKRERQKSFPESVQKFAQSPQVSSPKGRSA